MQEVDYKGTFHSDKYGAYQTMTEKGQIFWYPLPYHLSWLYAYLGQEEVAIQFLRKSAVSGVLPSVDELMSEEWLAPLRQTVLFRAFLNELPKDR